MLYRLSCSGFIQRITNANYVAGKATGKTVVYCVTAYVKKDALPLLLTRREKREQQDKGGQSEIEVFTNPVRSMNVDYGLDVSEIESRWARNFSHPFRLAKAPSCTRSTGNKEFLCITRTVKHNYIYLLVR